MGVPDGTSPRGGARTATAREQKSGPPDATSGIRRDISCRALACPIFRLLRPAAGRSGAGAGRGPGAAAAVPRGAGCGSARRWFDTTATGGAEIVAYCIQPMAADMRLAHECESPSSHGQPLAAQPSVLEALDVGCDGRRAAPACRIQTRPARQPRCDTTVTI